MAFQMEPKQGQMNATLNFLWLMYMTVHIVQSKLEHFAHHDSNGKRDV
jgi:hypothetical protein